VSGIDPKTEPIAIRRIAYFNGNVQGVGFRYTACQIAKDHAVVGYVKNLLDGRVEIIAEGFPQDVDRFVAEVEEIMKSYIEFTTGTDSTATAEYDSFTIEY
jgi:acylphosphatase